MAALKIADVDSARMVLHVEEGKGGKDRDLVLSPRLLEELRQHYRRLRRKPAIWLLPGGTRRTADTPISEKVVWHACRRATQQLVNQFAALQVVQNRAAPDCCVE